jgi:SET domain-containing protein
MILVETWIRPSAIHGLGLFARQFIKAGTKVWEYREPCDCQIPNTKYPEKMQKFLDVYAYAPKGKDCLEVCGDQSMFINHSYEPMLVGDDTLYAARDIAVGEELTANYYEFCDDAESGGELK